MAGNSDAVEFFIALLCFAGSRGLLANARGSVSRKMSTGPCVGKGSRYKSTGWCNVSKIGGWRKKLIVLTKMVACIKRG